MEYLKILQSVAQGVPVILTRLYSVMVIMYGFLGAALYWATLPLRYPAYYAFAITSRVLSVLFSPLWFTWKMCTNTTLMVVNFLSGLKMLFNFLTGVRSREIDLTNPEQQFTCAIIVGLVAALAAHGVSRLIAMLLHIHPSQQKAVQGEESSSGPRQQQQRIPAQNGVGGPQPQQQKQQKSRANRRLDPSVQLSQQQRTNGGGMVGFEDYDEDDYYYIEANDGDGESLAGSSTTGRAGRFTDIGGATTTSSESAFNNPTTSRRRGAQKASPILNFGGSDMYKRDWRSLSSNMKSSGGLRRGGSIRSLLAQTIHEESSESDSL
ncbi:uncharacterized protein PG998_008292 [Apiospora kogelbergensis]|uniref:Uncharacterized protein n=1 Tax=Apiospora kogelbergensis TaxID=1337665 RepID=A0AAW0QF43_9PEZI